jgi:hypothetical protein
MVGVIGPDDGGVQRRVADRSSKTGNAGILYPLRPRRSSSLESVRADAVPR